MLRAPVDKLAGDVTQTVTGTAISNGTGASPTLNIGNVHVGVANTYNYQIANAGTNGPALRGAVQTTVNGGNITDTRLSGSGVTAANFAAIATGSHSDNLNVSFTSSNAGVLAPLTGQAVALTNNFGNVSDQVLHVNLAPNAAAYTYASANTLPATVNFGSHRVGEVIATQALNVSNMAAAGAYSENLQATYSSAAAPFTFNKNGGTDIVLAGNSATGVVGLSSATAGDFSGANKGVVNVGLTSIAGAADLTNTTLPSQSVNLRVVRSMHLRQRSNTNHQC
ncbi:MAG: hypothetical protein HOP02_12485 [Methylococcaceae bacterium]|nr:hypothetical protein [Methylococcaceae bacterium]